MKKAALLSLLFLSLSSVIRAQEETMPYGKINPTDLELKECEFEKDANAMVLFDKADVFFDQQFDITMERHKRIKIFNENAKDEANIRLEYFSTNHFEDIFSVQAQTINFHDGKPVITKLDKKQIFTERIDKNRSALIFTFPNVQPGSVIEFKYLWKTSSLGNFPNWYFQSRLPTRYSELKTNIPDILYYKSQYKVHQPLAKHQNSSESRSIPGISEMISTEIKLIALRHVPSLRDEPFMTSRYDNLQAAVFQLTQIKPIGGFVQRFLDTWEKVGGALAADEDFGAEVKKKLKTDPALVAKAKELKSDQEKIAYLFNEVRSSMKWNGIDNWYTNDGLTKALEKKTGNSTEINLILYHLLRQADVKNVYPMVVSTRDHGRVNISFPWLYQFNRAVVLIKTGEKTKLVLDASDRYQTYQTIPDNLLNSYGMALNMDDKRCWLEEIANAEPSRKNVLITAEIKPEGRMTGNASLYDFAHHKINAVKVYKTDGEEKFKELLTGKDNSIKISSLKIDDADIDTLPLHGSLEFDIELKGADGTYLYFNPNIFTSLTTNPFLSEKRSTIIDFGHNNKYLLSGVFKIPEGYKPDFIPKSLSLVMPDKSISFKRTVQEQEGNIMIRYVVDFNKTLYIQDEYPALHEFYKQMFEMLNEQIVLKKS